MTRQEKNETFLLTSFLYGGNATYIEGLYERFRNDPNSVDDTWRSFFGKLADTPADITANANGPSWERKDWPQSPKSEMVSALDGDWGDLAVKTEKALGKKAVAEAAPSAAAPVDIGRVPPIEK